MATKTTTTLTDDLDGSPADTTVRYSWDGQEYEIDLNSKNAEEFTDALAPYLAASRTASGPAPRGNAGRDGGRRRARPSTPTAEPADATAVDPATVRAWAQANDVAVSPRGRLSHAVLEQYRNAQ